MGVRKASSVVRFFETRKRWYEKREVTLRANMALTKNKKRMWNLEPI
jgi:hypothetical protein